MNLNDPEEYSGWSPVITGEKQTFYLRFLVLLELFTLKKYYIYIYIFASLIFIKKKPTKLAEVVSSGNKNLFRRGGS